MTKVTVIDYGIGNLLSVQRAFEHLGAEVLLSSKPEEIALAGHLILPGVGAFAHGIQGLSVLGLDEAVVRHAKSGKPLLGICLGMQMLLETSSEFGQHKGLGLIAGHVDAIPATDASGAPHRIPHIGWNRLTPPNGRSWEGSLLAATPPGDSVYFVHSFAAYPANLADNLAVVDYNGRSICATIQAANVMGCQFHPEKSGDVGLRILRSFLEIA